MSYFFCFIFIASSFATFASDELLVHLKLKNYINEISYFGNQYSATKCGDVSNPSCPDVHVSKWCQQQDEILKTPALKKRPQQNSKEKSILFLAEEHGDENAYDYYEKLISKEEFDCLFLELPNVFQKNFDNKKGIAHDHTSFTSLEKKLSLEQVNKIQLKDSTYLGLLKSLVQKAKSNDVEVILVDSSKRSILEKSIKDSLGQRNEAMAKNIKAAFDNKSCSHGLSIKGTQHLFAKSKTVKPVDQILKNLSSDEIDIKKAMLYSAGSKSFKEAMGPCSWVNKLPQQDEVYYSKKAFEHQKIFPDQIEKSMKDLSNVQMTNDVDYVVMLPLNLSKEYFVKTLNKDKSLPRRFKLKKQMSTKAIDVPLNLKTNASTLGVSFGQESLASQCIHFCSDKDLNSEYLISDISILKPTIKCQPYHPSRTGGASYAPEYQANYELTLDCYCTK